MEVKVRYNMFTVIKPTVRKRLFTKKGRLKIRSMYLCKCDCGVLKEVDIDNLKSGNTKSCGCFRKIDTGNRKRTHGLSRSSEYGIWTKMKNRCYNQNTRDYRWYGALGIKVCKRWLTSFENFLSDMGKRPSKKHSIERINSLRDYKPSNCIWATQDIQIRNTSQIIWVKYKGVDRKLIELCEEYDLHSPTIRRRVNNGWNVELALFAPKYSVYKTLIKSKIQ